jgi:hypothetical protein
MPLTWRLDLKDKQEIMMGYECCYRQELLDQVKKDYTQKSIALKLKEKPKRLRFTQSEPSPTGEQLKAFWILNAIDLAMTIYALDHPNIYESNPLLGLKPSNRQLISHKLIVGPVVAQNMNQYQMTFVNAALTLAVINNLIVMNKYDVI